MRRGKLSTLGFLVIILIVVVSMLTFGCKSTSSTSTTTTQAKTLKIGYEDWTSFPPGMFWAKELQLMTDLINQQGGLTVGGDKYNIDLITYDSNNTQTTAMAAINKLVYQDQVKFILTGTGGSVESALSITEPNKVLVSCMAMGPTVLDSKYNYVFMTGVGNCGTVIFSKWFLETYPDKNDIVIVMPDMQMGHILGAAQMAIMKSAGLNVRDEYYPPDQTDLSSLGTKIKSENPGAVWIVQVPPIKAIRDAGYTGLVMSVQAYAIDDLLAQSTPEALEGYIGEAMPTEFDPALTTTAQDFKNAYIAKYGKWDNMDMLGTTIYQALITAIQKAGSVDVDKVAAVLSNGMTWTSPVGEQKMVSRPDMGNSRTVDSVTSFYIKQIQNGKPQLIATINLADAVKSYTDSLANMPPMSGPPPAGH